MRDQFKCIMVQYMQDKAARGNVASSLRDHYDNETVSFNFKGVGGRPLALPAEAAGPKAEYLEWHQEHVFGRS